MPTRNVNLTKQLDAYIDEVVASGDYQNASELMRDGVRLLRQRRMEGAAKLARLRAATREGEEAIARGEYEDVHVDNLDNWIDSLKVTAQA
jgi:antitoxin ParD1/3/4